MSKISGSCLCGKVLFESNNTFDQFHFCHCIQCQKITGSAHAANLFTDPANIQWLSGEEFIKRFEYPGRDFSKAFCTECGCTVPFISGSGKALIVPAGCLDGKPDMEAQDNIFCDEKASWYDKGLSAQPFAKFPE